jgi:hypothetical protein
MKLFFGVPGEVIRLLMQRVWKGSLGFYQHGLLMTPNKNDRGHSGHQGKDEQPDTDRPEIRCTEEPSTYPPKPKIDDQMSAPAAL